MPEDLRFHGRDPGDARRRDEPHPARNENAMCRSQRGPNVIDERQQLRDEHAVERLVGDVGRVDDVGDERRPRVVLLDVEDVGLAHCGTELADVLVAGDLEHAALNVGRVSSHELFHVVAVDRSAAALSRVPKGVVCRQSEIPGLPPRRSSSLGSDAVHPFRTRSGTRSRQKRRADETTSIEVDSLQGRASATDELISAADTLATENGTRRGPATRGAASTQPVGAHRLLRRDDWLMSSGERAALEGVLLFVEPRLSIEIGTYSGGSLASISAHSAKVHSFDLASHPSVTQERMPNVDFHIGDSHELLPLVLRELELSGETIDFVFVDGDHSAEGVRRDVLDLLESPCTPETVILLHDTLHVGVRSGLEQVDFSTFESVCFVDLDLVQGRVAKEGPQANKLLWGLGIVVTGDRLDVEWPTPYSAPELYAGFSLFTGRVGCDRRAFRIQPARRGLHAGSHA